MSILRHNARADSNQSAIIAALESCGATVQVLATVGNGCPDLLVGWCGDTFLIEVKVSGKKLNEKQVAWHESWGGRKPSIVYGIVDALRVIGAL
jgi:hypothetical protein